MNTASQYKAQGNGQGIMRHAPQPQQTQIPSQYLLQQLQGSHATNQPQTDSSNPSLLVQALFQGPQSHQGQRIGNQQMQPHVVLGSQTLQSSSVVPPGQNQPTSQSPHYDTIQVDDPTTFHWQHQVQLVQMSRKCNQPHFYARHAAVSSRKLLGKNGNNNVPGVDGSQGNQPPNLLEATKTLLMSTDPTAEQAESGENKSATDPLLWFKKLSNDTQDEDEEIDASTLKDPTRQLWRALDLSGQQLLHLSEKLFRYDFLTKLYLNGNGLTELPSSIRQLKSLTVLDVSQNLLSSFPPELGILFNLRYIYAFDNRLTDIPYEFGNLYELEFLGIEGNVNMNPEYVNILAKRGSRGLTIHLRDNAPRPTPPKSRQWIYFSNDGEIIEEQEYRQQQTEDDLVNTFTMMTYNTLCQHYATKKMYRYTPSWALDWDYRRERLKEQILDLQTDIICLQEVEHKTFDDFWQPIMLSHGYKGIFHVKSRAKTMKESSAYKVDGCATFYRTSKFQAVERKHFEYGRIAMSQDKFKKTEDLFNRFLNKDNIASVLILEHIPSGNKLVVANTHLHWDPEFNDVKTMQVGVLLDELQAVIRKHLSPKDITKVPLLICGDFNSKVHSAVYQLFSQGTVDKHEDIVGRDYGKFTEEGFRHPFHLQSSYDSIGELPYTNVSPTFTDVIDYIWYSTPSLSVKGVLGQVDPDYSKNIIGFPNADFPSDHIPLLSTFMFKKSSAPRPDTRVDFRSDFRGSRKT
ncbi:BA75_04847T0 [Komagataella pastoris]|uniref:CCR4-Not complex 3'-5'-exoribonuclease subunit Ccr4 n=1 Tax=Komagataella pastoris TaxID=4922 RepID=A0A1B2JIQ5_PICPA|nr:BA75_04847T0 [Komagataella pastoris]